MGDIATLIVGALTALAAVCSAVVLAIHHRKSLAQYWRDTQETRMKVYMSVVLILWMLAIVAPWPAMLRLAMTFSNTHQAFSDTHQATAAAIEQLTVRVVDLTESVHELEIRVADLEGQ